MFVRSQAAAVIIYSWAPKRTCFICLCDLKWPYCVGGEWPVASLDFEPRVGSPFLLASLDTRGSAEERFSKPLKNCISIPLT